MNKELQALIANHRNLTEKYEQASAKARKLSDEGMTDRWCDAMHLQVMLRYMLNQTEAKMRSLGHML